MTFRTTLGIFLGFGLCWTPATFGEDWPQWAGPSRDFRISLGDDSVDVWPESGLRSLWKKSLGLGYSSIAAVGDRLYTVDREDDTERIVCLSAESGETLWQFAYDATHLDDMRTGYGTGPHATPLVVDGRLFVTSTTGLLQALNAEDGALLWKKDLWGEMEGTFLVRGFASSALAYEKTIILPVGGEKQGFVAFDQATGEVVWRSAPFNNSQSSPVLVDVGMAEDPDWIVVSFVNDFIVAADPEDGQELWRIEHTSGAAYNITTPVIDPEKRHLFVSSAYGGGTRGLSVSREKATELWHTSRMKVQFTNIVWIDGYIYGTSGNVGAVILAGVDAATGKMLWKDRKIRRSQLLVIEPDRLLALSEDGELKVVRPSPEGAEVLAETSVGESKTWTIPTVVGDRLYLRNEGSVMAFALR